MTGFATGHAAALAPCGARPRSAAAAGRPDDAAGARHPGGTDDRGIELSIVIPTYNEAGNIGELLRRIAVCLGATRWEAIVVDDDSADGTADIVVALGASTPRVRCLRRVGRRGLASACLEGMAMAAGTFVAVIDADLQHDEQLLRPMLREMQTGTFDLVVGSRYMAGGATTSWSAARRRLSRAATALTRRVLQVELSDPMSGFFMIRPQVVADAAPRLSGRGFKLLLDLVASSATPLAVRELPYHFAPRRSGASKLDAAVGWAFLALLADKAAARAWQRFGLFCLVGSSGVGVQLALSWALQAGAGTPFAQAQTAAVLASMASNFALNNRLTHRAARLRGRGFMNGLLRFCALCTVGAIVNVGVACLVEQASRQRAVSVAAGIAAGALVNYATTSMLVWHRHAATAA